MKKIILLLVGASFLYASPQYSWTAWETIHRMFPGFQRLLLLGVGGDPAAGSGIPAFIQAADNTTSCGGGASCASLPMAGSLTNPSLLINCLSGNPATNNITYSDSATHTWTDWGTGGVVVQTGVFGRCSYALNTGTNASVTGTVSTAGDFNLNYDFIAEFSGVAASLPVDQVGSNLQQTSGAGTNNMACPTLNLSATNELVVCWLYDGGFNTPTAGTDATLILAPAAHAGGVEYHIYNGVSGAQTIHWTASQGSGAAYSTIAVAFKHS